MHTCVLASNLALISKWINAVHILTIYLECPLQFGAEICLQRQKIKSSLECTYLYIYNCTSYLGIHHCYHVEEIIKIHESRFIWSEYFADAIPEWIYLQRTSFLLNNHRLVQADYIIIIIWLYLLHIMYMNVKLPTCYLLCSATVQLIPSLIIQLYSWW